jgi:predicted DNA-binding transcriptional regulator YafY
MSQLERVYQLDKMLRRRNPPTRGDILTELEVSPAQFKRDLAFMRDRLGAPIAFDSRSHSYRYSAGDFNLPGLWFSEPEVYSMLLMHSLLEQLQPGIVREQLQPFEAKLKSLLDKSSNGMESILKRIQVSASPQRPVNPDHFQAICEATLRRKRLRIRYFSRSRAVEGERIVSPQRLNYYRGNWYLDTWCHDKSAPRRFAVDAVREVFVLEEPAKDAPDMFPQSEGQGYGIFAGPADHTAVLRFDPEAARWVREEEWHPKQKVTSLPDGGVQLEVPYSLPQEILMDILRHGPHVEVLQPMSLRSAAADALRQAAERYVPPKRGVASARPAASDQITRTRRAR